MSIGCMDNNDRDVKLGRAIVGIAWLVFAAKFILVATAIAFVILYLIGKPLWMAPVVGVVIFAVYRLIWRLIWLFIEWAGKQK